ncbi:MAG: hypothetical protein ACOC00_03100 [Halothiobacillaceae bacterium]
MSLSSGTRVPHRPVTLVVTALLALLLVAALALAYLATQQRLEAAQAVRSAQFALAEAEQRVADAERQQQLAVLVEDLRERIDASGYRDEAWSARRVSLRQVQLDRDEAERVLADIMLGQSRHFAVDDMDLAVTHVDAGLFDVNDVVDQPLRLTLRGKAHFRLLE